MIPVRMFKDRRVGVLGLGRSGLATARALAAGGAHPVCWDDTEDARATAAAEGFEIADLGREREAESLEALIVSPGIPHLYPAPHRAIALAWESGVPVDNDVGLFFRTLLDAAPDDFDEDLEPPRIIAVTGSNGKSTTTALIHHILSVAGRSVQMGGNIGRGVLDLDVPDDGQIIVLELSSYQIDLARTLGPEIAVFLNLSPDHLDRHGGLGGYFAAKRRLFEIGAPETSVIGVDEVEGKALASVMPGVIPISVTRRLRDEGRSIFVHRGHLTEWRGKQIAAFDLRTMAGLTGTHNHQNACAAYAVCRTLGLAPRRIEEALATFPGLAHRMEPLGERDGIAFVNDSKATNAEAAEKALVSFDSIRWIAGGLPKETGITALLPHMDRVAGAYFFGAAAESFAAMATTCPARVFETLDDATAAALADAEAGDTVLLSPAAASFDQFQSFEARGDAFRAIIATHLGKEDA